MIVLHFSFHHKAHVGFDHRRYDAYKMDSCRNVIRKTICGDFYDDLGGFFEVFGFAMWQVFIPKPPSIISVGREDSLLIFIIRLGGNNIVVRDVCGLSSQRVML
ncbi:hypothetical protein O6H91_15G080200 [Diphasiastrum complanatum]|uniref:Uncharacterized protein n=1 Tax=Diphasiastrum complanatum TaxID=34168 RepID=A0ACC2BK62_DIPCM|nr:hypothetical protein O6H91_15G080200 [Diphasiastrum complanatum]